MAASRSQVRNAVKSWIEAGNIPTLNQVLTSFPKRINFQVNSQAGQMTRAAGVVFIADEQEGRISYAGENNGWKRIDYTIDFQIFQHSLNPKAESAMDDFDTLIDNVKNQLRSGAHRLGLPDNTVIFQAAEPSITVSYGEPATREGGAVEIWAAVRFTVTQMFQA